MIAIFKRVFGSSNKKRVTARKGRQGGLMGRLVLAGDRWAFSWPVRQGLYRHLVAQVSNGVPVEMALDTYRGRLQRRGKISSDKIVADVARRMRDGSTLAMAMGKWVPADEMGVIESGELSGNLAGGLELIIDAKRRLQSVKRAVKAALVTPAIYLAAIFGLVWMFGRMIPAFESTLPRNKATGFVSGLYTVGDFTNSWWMVTPVVIIAVMVVLVNYSLPRWVGRSRIKVESIFPYSFYRDLNGYTWLMAFAALLRAGQADVEILKRQMKTATPWLRERLYSLWWRMDNGAGLGDALLAKGKKGMPAFGFPNPDIVDDIASTAGFSDFSERIVKIASQWADDLEHETMLKARSFGVLAEIIMYSIMGLLVVAINDLSSQMGNLPAM